MSKPALPKETITSTSGRPAREAYAFETTGDEKPGKFVITDGLAEFA